MQLPPPLHDGTLLRRYKRFLADVRLDDGREVTAHCPNPGRMTSCAIPGGRVRLTANDDPRRKLKWTWQTATAEDGRATILINTNLANGVVVEGIRAGAIPALSGYTGLRTEVRYGTENRSRIDVLLSGPTGARAGGPEDCYVEVKSVTLRVEDGRAAFPDAKTDRGRKHLDELAAVAAAGHRAVQLFLVSRDDVTAVRPADEVDPRYAAALRRVAAAGVEVMAVQAIFDGDQIRCGGAVPVEL